MSQGSFPVGSFVRVRRWPIGETPPPVGRHDVYEVLTNQYDWRAQGPGPAPCILGRRTSQEVYPDRVDELSVSRLVEVTTEDLVAALTDSRRHAGLTVAELVGLLTGGAS